VEATLGHADVKIKCAACTLICELVVGLDKKAWAPLVRTAGVLTSLLEQLAQANLQDQLQECLQSFCEVAECQPDFFKQQMQTSMEPGKLMAKIVKTQSVEEGVRTVAMEWIVQYCEMKPKWLAKHCPTFVPLALECCMDLMLEVEDGQAELQAWIDRMDDEEGDEDYDIMYNEGSEAIDRVVQAFTKLDNMDPIKGALFALVGNFSAKKDSWQALFAALSAIKQTVEYIDDPAHVDQMATLLVNHVDHPHARVRYVALNALGQVANDQSPNFQEKSHQSVMPMLLRKFSDEVDRVASMAMSAFVSFGEELDEALMTAYAPEFMNALVSRLRSSKHRMVQEESITSIAVIAGVIEKDFSQYYDGIMPMLKVLLMNAKGEKESRLRGKAFECMSLLGAAVGKEKFYNDAKEAVEEMLKTPMEADDLQREYIKEASERICKTLNSDFKMFLPHLLPNLFKSLSLENSNASGGDDEDEDVFTFKNAEGKMVKVHCSKFEEIMQATQLLNTYCVEMEGSFYDYVPDTAKVLLPIMSTSGETAFLCEDARAVAFQTWASLIKVAKVGAQERNQPATLVQELLRTFLTQAITMLSEAKGEDAKSLSAVAEGLRDCLKNAGAGVVNAQEASQIVQVLFAGIDLSFQRSETCKQKKDKNHAGAPPELQKDEDDEDDDEDDEENCRRSFEDAIGAVMQVAPQEFLQCLPECTKRMTMWLSVKERRTLALFLACDLIEHLKDQSTPAWPVFMPHVMTCLTDTEADVRIPASYAVSLAAPLASFAEAAPQAFQALGKILQSPAPKKSDTQAKVAMDNCVQAMFMLAKEQTDKIPADVPAWSLVVSKLPLKEDEDEAKKIHNSVGQLLLAQHQGLLGPDNCHIGQVLSCLAEVYKQENLCTKETDELILRIFKMLPRENLSKLAGGFTEKQQRKIEKMLSEP